MEYNDGFVPILSSCLMEKSTRSGNRTRACIHQPTKQSQLVSFFILSYIYHTSSCCLHVFPFSSAFLFNYIGGVKTIENFLALSLMIFSFVLQILFKWSKLFESPTRIKKRANCN